MNFPFKGSEHQYLYVALLGLYSYNQMNLCMFSHLNWISVIVDSNQPWFGVQFMRLTASIFVLIFLDRELVHYRTFVYEFLGKKIECIILHRFFWMCLKLFWIQAKLVRSFWQVYGNNVEIQAMCEMYNRPIHIYSYSIGGLLKLWCLIVYVTSL